jgi:hypothetical protein
MQLRLDRFIVVKLEKVKKSRARLSNLFISKINSMGLRDPLQQALQRLVHLP